jgi:DNA polymerase III sliding clamp (beta) subunit (PCNA family)
MLDALRFARGAVADRSMLPVLSHFHIRDGRITGYNGKLALSAPVPLDIDIRPKAEPFTRALAMCEGETTLTVTPAQRLVVKSGAFRAVVDCTTDEYPEPTINSEPLAASFGGLLGVMQKLVGYVGVDAARPWSRGMLLHGGSIFATNNIVLIEYWHGVPTERVNLPVYTVQELIRVGEVPATMQLTADAVRFHYSDERWVHSNLLATDWPDLTGLLGRASNPVALPPGFFDGLRMLVPFAGPLKSVTLFPDRMTTTPHMDEEGASVSMAIPVTEPVTFNLHMLLSLEPVLSTIDLTMYPDPCLFYGHNLRGCIVGMRQ